MLYSLGYSWFIVFIFAVLLPSPTIWYQYKQRKLNLHQQNEAEFGETNNPLADDFGTAPPPRETNVVKMVARANQAKMQREAQKAETDNRKLRAQVEELQSKLRVAVTSTPTSASESLSDGINDSEDPAPSIPTQELIVKELVEDDMLSDEIRESAKKALDVLASSKIQSLEAQFVTQTSLAQQDLEIARQRQAMVAEKRSEIEASATKEMTEWLAHHRLLRFVDVIARVAGPDSSPEDLQYLTESDVQEIGNEMTNIEKHRMQEALQALAPTLQPQPEPQLE